MHPLILITFLCILNPISRSQIVKHEHSLTGPFSTAIFKDWYLIGGAEMSESFITLTSAEANKYGAIWNAHRFLRPDWEIQIHFVVHGQATTFGDGLAIWYAKDSLLPGPVFGSKDYFSGLGVFIDTREDVTSPHKHSHPYISAVVNNGSLKYHHDEEGTHGEIGGCHADLRNKDYLTRIAIAYIDKTISVFTDAEGTGIWKSCFTKSGVHLPTNYYFGVSSSTSDFIDNHNVISITGMEYDIPHANIADLVNVVPYVESQPSTDFVDQQQNVDQFLAETLLHMQDMEKKMEDEQKLRTLEKENIEREQNVKELEKEKLERDQIINQDKKIMEETLTKHRIYQTDSPSVLVKSIYILGTIAIIVIGISTCTKYFSRRREFAEKRLY